MENTMSYREQLLGAVKSYCEKTGRARSGVAKEIMNDAKFFDRIEDGGGCTMDSFEKAMKWLAENNSMPQPPNGKKKPNGESAH